LLRLDCERPQDVRNERSAIFSAFAQIQPEAANRFLACDVVGAQRRVGNGRNNCLANPFSPSQLRETVRKMMSDN
jgi:hypothetical protein